VEPSLKPRPRPERPPEPPRKAEPSHKAEPNPAPRRAPKADAPLAGTVAAGAGGGAASGEQGAAQAGAGPGDDALAAWGNDIRARVERRKTYPRDAQGATGVVTLLLTVTPEGRIVALSVAESSGVPALDAAALRAVQSAGRLPRGPDGTDPAGHTFRFRLRYEG
jgi:protein TonB